MKIIIGKNEYEGFDHKAYRCMHTGFIECITLSLPYPCSDIIDYCMNKEWCYVEFDNSSYVGFISEYEETANDCSITTHLTEMINYIDLP